MTSVSGHVGELSSCAWHPRNSQTFITSSADSTIRYILTLLEFSRFTDRRMDRIWDLEDKRKQKSVIVIKSKERGARTRVNACAYSQDGNMIGGGEPFFQLEQ